MKLAPNQHRSKQTDTIKVTLDIPADQHTALKVAAATQNTAAADMIRAALDATDLETLTINTERPTKETIRRTTLNLTLDQHNNLRIAAAKRSTSTAAILRTLVQDLIA